jgi:hypothetical protein
VTKSGSRDFHGSGYWYGRRSDWNANSWTNNAQRRDAEAKTSATTRATPSAARSSRRASTRARRSCSSSSARSTSVARDRGQRQTRVPTALERHGDFSQSVDSAATRSRTSGLRHRPAVRRGQHQRLLPGRRRLGAFRRAGSTRPAAHAQHVPDVELRAARGLNFISQAPTTRRAVKTCCAWTTRRRQLARHGPLHAHEGRHRPGLRHDLGRQRQRPAPDADAVPAPRRQLHAVGDGRAQPDDVPRSELGPRGQLAELRAAARSAVPRERGVRAAAVFYPDAVQGDYVPWFQFNGGAPATPVSTRPIAVRSRTRT